MQGQQNKFTLDLRDNAELKDAFASKKVGEKCEFTITAQIDEKSDENIVGTIESIEPKGYENPNAEPGDDKGEIEPDSKSPVMLAIGKSMGMTGSDE